MTYAAWFIQECSTCGRKLQVPMNYLGKQVVCRHCGAEIRAVDPSTRPTRSAPSGELLDRAESLIRSASRVLDEAAAEKSSVR